MASSSDIASGIQSALNLSLPFPESLRLFHGLLSKQEIYRRNTGKSAQLMFSQDNRVLLSLFIFIVLFI